MKKLSIILLLLLNFGCNRNPKFYEGDFFEIYKLAQKENKKLWVLFGGDENCIVCNDLVKKIKQSPIIKEYNNDYLFLKCDLTKYNNKILQYILLPQEIPNSYIFNENGELVYASARNESIHTIEQAIKDVDDEKKYCSPQNQFSTKECDKLLKLHNLTLKAYLNIKNDIEFTNLIDSSISIEPYFYNLYLKSKKYRDKGFITFSDDWRKVARNYCQNTFHRLTYNDLLIEIADTTIENDCAKLAIDNLPTDLQTIKYGEPKKIEIKISNIGNKPLVLYNVITNCSCNKITYSKKPIMPNETSVVRLSYKSSVRGYFKIELTIHSNAAESLKRIELQGHVK